MSSSAGEWGLVELQGQLETRDQVPFDNMHIGDLHFDGRGTPSLIVGHHLLTGKIIELEKPFAVLRKKSGATADSERSSGMGTNQTAIPEADDDDDGMELLVGTGMGVESKFGTKVNTEYEVVALITKKIIFKNRPKPIITKPLPRKQL